MIPANNDVELVLKYHHLDVGCISPLNAGQSHNLLLNIVHLDKDINCQREYCKGSKSL